MHLSKGERVTLVKSTSSNLPTYFMSLFHLSVGVANHIEQWQFLLGGIGNELKFHLVNWSKACAPISEGGLGSIICFCSTKLFWESGFGIMFMKDRPFGKWLWILNMVERGVGSVQMRSISHKGVVLWKNIKRGSREFSSHTRFGVSNFDMMCGVEHALKAAFPDLFSLSHCKDAYVVWIISSSLVTLINIHFLKAAHD